jgi:hypothetical protein
MQLWSVRIIPSLLWAFTKRNVTDFGKLNKSSAFQVMDGIKKDLLLFPSSKEPKKIIVTNRSKA